MDIAHAHGQALLDLEIPTDWTAEEFLLKRNQLRLALHLNIALCAVKDGEGRWDEAIWHSSRALKIDNKNVKARSSVVGMAIWHVHMAWPYSMAIYRMAISHGHIAWPCCVGALPPWTRAFEQAGASQRPPRGAKRPQPRP